MFILYSIHSILYHPVLILSNLYYHVLNHLHPLSSCTQSSPTFIIMYSILSNLYHHVLNLLQPLLSCSLYSSTFIILYWILSNLYHSVLNSLQTCHPVLNSLQTCHPVLNSLQPLSSCNQSSPTFIILYSILSNLYHPVFNPLQPYHRILIFIDASMPGQTHANCRTIKL